MRLLKLEILNLASLDRQEGEVINFEEGALKDSTIFSIVGSTGSGKSTILDAICLALYGRAPRYPRQKRDRNQAIKVYGEMDENEKHRLAPTDCRNILTRGKKDGYSKLTFLANNGNVYRAEWYVHFNLKKYDDAITALYKITSNGGLPVEEACEWSELTQIVGLDYEQFLRTVLIAQGSFANFLTAKEDERYELLEKLIGCEEMYTNIANMIKQKVKEANDELNKVNLSISAQDQYLIKSEDELLQKKDKLEELEKADKEASDELVKIAEALGWYKDEDAFVENIAKYDEAYIKAKGRLDEIKDDVEKLALHDSTLPAVGYYKEIEEAKAKIKKYEGDVARIEEDMKKKNLALGEENSKLETLKTEAQKAGDELETQKPHINRARTIKGELSAAVKSVEDKRQAKDVAEKAKKDADKAVDDNAAAIKRAEEASNKAVDDSAKLQNELATKKAEIESAVEVAQKAYDDERVKIAEVDAAVLQNAKSAAEKKQADLKDAVRVRKSIDSNITTQKKNAEDEIRLTARNKEIDEEIGKLNIEDLSAEISTLTKTCTLLNSENWKQHRTDLVEGKECPLCGSIHHPYKDDAVFAPVAKEIELCMNKKKAELDKQNKQKDELSDEKSKNEGKLEGLAGSAQKIADDQKSLFAEWDKISAKYPEWSEDVEALESLIHSVDAEVKDATAALDAYNVTVKQVEKLRLAKEKAEKNRSEWSDNAEKQRRDAESKVNVAKTTLETERGKKDNLLAQQTERNSALVKAKDDLVNADALKQRKEDAIKAEVGDKDPELFEKQLNKAKADADKAVEAKKNDIAKINESLRELQGKLNTTNDALANEKTKSLEKAALLDEWLDNYNAKPEHSSAITDDDIARLYSSTDDWESIRAQQKQLENALNTAETTLKNEKNKHDAHQAKKPADEKDALETRQAEIKSRDNSERTNLKMELQHHDNAKKQLGDLYEKQQDAKMLSDEWKEIDDAIGSDGKTLRKIAQCYTLRFLIEHSNVEIRKFNSRYELQQVKNSLGIRVIDHDRADDVRDITSLSGGETFIVSLGLALGLSSLSSRNISFENLFVDEGFGTLDPGALATVIDSLATLQSSQGKKVGVISHTDTMSERIVTQIRIIKNGNTGSSHIEVYP